MYSINSTPDPDLLFSYHLDTLFQELHYLENSWIWKKEKPCLLVTGAENWLGHYLLHILSELDFPLRLVALGQSDLPDYLKNERYQKIEYQTSLSLEDLKKNIAHFQPDLILNAANIRDLKENSFTRLYEQNVKHSEVVCETAISHNVARIIMFSDSTVYGPGEEIAKEDHELNPVLNLGKSFWEAEQIASCYHQPGKTEIYHLRLAPCYGPLITYGATYLAYLMSQGILLGCPENIDQEISVIHGKDIALAAFLIAFAPNPGYRVFNIAGESTSLGQLLRLIEPLIEKKKFLGFSSRLCQIMQVGYQKEIVLPQSLLQFMGKFSENWAEFLDYARFEKNAPYFNQRVAQYIKNLRPLSNKRLKDMLAWTPENTLAEIPQTIAYWEKENWQSWQTEKTSTPYETKVLIPLFDSVSEMVESLQKYSGEKRKETPYKLIDTLDVEVDLKSLWILVERVKSQLPTILLHQRKNKKHFLEIFFLIKKNFLLLLKHEHSIADRKHPHNTSQKIKWLTQRIGEVNGEKLTHYATISVLTHLILQIRRYQKEYATFLKLFPNKSYGFFLGSDIGDIGIVIKIKNGQAKVLFLRKQIDQFPHSWYFPKRVAEFKKIANLDIALGVRLEKLISDLGQNSLPESFLQNFGSDYLLTNIKKEYLEMIGSKASGSPITHYLFINRNGKVDFGFHFIQGQIKVVNNSYINYINVLKDEFKETEAIIQIVRKVSQGKEELAFFKIKTIKRLLAEITSLARVPRVILKFFERSNGNGAKKSKKENKENTEKEEKSS